MLGQNGLSASILMENVLHYIFANASNLTMKHIFIKSQKKILNTKDKRQSKGRSIHANSHSNYRADILVFTCTHVN